MGERKIILYHSFGNLRMNIMLLYLISVYELEENGEDHSFKICYVF